MKCSLVLALACSMSLSVIVVASLEQPASGSSSASAVENKQYQQQQQHLQQQQQPQQQQQQQQQLYNSNHEAGRQGRSLASPSSSGTNNLSQHNNGHSNMIDHSTHKAKLEAEKRQVAEFLTTKNIFKSIIKLLFGSQDEISATSRNVISILSKVLDVVKSQFGQRARSGGMRSSLRDSAENAASAGVSILQGYVNSVLATDETCMKLHLCKASREAVKDARDLGYVVATVGGYASSYLLEGSKSVSLKSLQEASVKGRSTKDDCETLYPCQENLKEEDTRDKNRGVSY